MLHNAVVLYRRTITFSYVVSTNQSRLRIPNVPYIKGKPTADVAKAPAHSKQNNSTANVANAVVAAPLATAAGNDASSSDAVKLRALNKVLLEQLKVGNERALLFVFIYYSTRPNASQIFQFFFPPNSIKRNVQTNNEVASCRSPRDLQPALIGRQGLTTTP